MPRFTEPASLFGQRLRQARTRVGMAQDKLGVAIGIDEQTSSARISRYETGTHAPSFEIAKRLAEVLKVPTIYFYCEEQQLADFLLRYAALTAEQRRQLLACLDTLTTASSD